ncbi:MAG: phosphonate metabolism transcriptional regulator PhnF, partial [Thermodesulfobacteriota bacterium]|nr:phosphonate metabolism transcriptional regulator PhnF [Thermodesulfobacteriota bacterium]
NIIDKSIGSQPIYRQVCTILETEIKKNYSPGDVLPAEIKLADRFNINRHTLRRAVDELVTGGLVDRIRGKGTYVVGSVIDYEIKRTTRFTENLESQGRRASSRVMRKVGVPATEEVAQQLNIIKNDPVVLIETLREVDEIPFCIVSHYFQYTKFYRVLKTYQQGSLHSFILQHYNLKLLRSQSLITAVMAEPDDAELLQITKNAPLLRVKSLNIDALTKDPVEFVITRFRGDTAQLSVEP